MEGNGDFYSPEMQQKLESWKKTGFLIGLMALCLFFLKSITWAVTFGIFAFDDQWANCVAADGVEQPINLLQ